ncbi:hypothetical protein [Roseivirga sp. UBA838]|uniref:hypothetical protein n=1 Tax=Roseivirga sp. UBA838 TaxID=1947393 RepID=UPI00257F89E3|nr:hypothetical protein [Roseivirga sp. UBA838]|tara:strand:- start:39354 stop:39749 length:396 start_codon:yes stop_codon:yes gene_type:complete
MKTVFSLSENHHVIQSYLNHKRAHFKVINRVGESECDILCRQINIEKINYAFVSKSDLERGLRSDLWVGLVLFIDGQKPTKYLLPSTVWHEPNRLFTDTAVKNPEYGINLNQHTMKEFVENYALEKMIENV